MFDGLRTDGCNNLFSGLFYGNTTVLQPPGAITLADLDALIDGVQQLAESPPDMWFVSPTMQLRYEKAIRHSRNWLDRLKAEQRRNERKRKRLWHKRRAVQRRHVRGGR